MERKAIRGKREELLTLVNVWDPAGLLGAGAPRDEYRVVVDKLLAQLRHDAGREEVAEFLEREIFEQFAVEPKNVAQFATKAVTWYRLSSSEDAG